MKKKALIFIVAALVIIGSAIGIGSTMAYFSSTAVSEGNEITSGTFALEGERDNGDWTPGPMFYKDEDEGLYPTGYWLPGAEYTRTYQIENVGDFDGDFTAIKAALAGDIMLADVLEVQISDDVDFQNIIASGKLSEFIGNGKNLTPTIPTAVGDVTSLWFKVAFPNGTPDVDNQYQGKNLSVDFAVYAQQQ